MAAAVAAEFAIVAVAEERVVVGISFDENAAAIAAVTARGAAAGNVLFAAEGHAAVAAVAGFDQDFGFVYKHEENPILLPIRQFGSDVVTLQKEGLAHCFGRARDGRRAPRTPPCVTGTTRTRHGGRTREIA